MPKGILGFGLTTAGQWKTSSVGGALGGDRALALSAATALATAEAALDSDSRARGGAKVDGGGRCGGR